MEDPRNDILNNAINEDGVIIVDVRSPDECTRDGSLKALGASNAINIPLDSLGAAIEMSDADFKNSYGVTKFSKDTRLVVHCKSGSASGRSFRGADQLKSAGFNAEFYPGGFLGWQDKFTARTLPS